LANRSDWLTPPLSSRPIQQAVPHFLQTIFKIAHRTNSYFIYNKLPIKILQQKLEDETTSHRGKDKSQEL
jgi:hypothetical protein